jgi:hypothetical protein
METTALTGVPSNRCDYLPLSFSTASLSYLTTGGVSRFRPNLQSKGAPAYGAFDCLLKLALIAKVTHFSRAEP